MPSSCRSSTACFSMANTAPAVAAADVAATQNLPIGTPVFCVFDGARYAGRISGFDPKHGDYSVESCAGRVCLQEAGVAAEAIVTDPRSVSTRSNARAAVGLTQPPPPFASLVAVRVCSGEARTTGLNTRSSAASGPPSAGATAAFAPSAACTMARA